MAALLLLAATGCGGGGGGESSTATDRVQVGTGEGTVSTGSAGQGAPIKVIPRHSGEVDGHLQKRLDRDARKLEQEAAEGQATSATAHHDTPTGSASFETKGGDNSIQEFGSEAGPSEFDQAAAALHGYLDARAAGRWARACSFLSPALATQLSQLSGPSKELPCARLLASLSAGLPPDALREAALADVGALRVEGERAFLLFHGAHDTDYFMPMAREAGVWMLAAIAPSALL